MHSTNGLKLKCQLTLRQNWKKHLFQPIKLSVMLASWHWNNRFQENSLSSWRMPASEVLDMPSSLKTIPIKRYSQSGKRTPTWRLAEKFPPSRNSRCPYTQKKFWQFTWHFLSLHTFCEKQQSQRLFWQITSLSHVFSKRKNFHQPTPEGCIWQKDFGKFLKSSANLVCTRQKIHDSFRLSVHYLPI